MGFTGVSEHRAILRMKFVWQAVVGLWIYAASACSHSAHSQRFGRVRQQSSMTNRHAKFTNVKCGSTRSLAAQWPHSRRLFIYMMFVNFHRHNSRTLMSSLGIMPFTVTEWRAVGELVDECVRLWTNELDHSSSARRVPAHGAETLLGVNFAGQSSNNEPSSPSGTRAFESWSHSSARRLHHPEFKL